MENNLTNKPSPEDTILSDQDLDLKQYNKHIRQARNAIYAAAALLFANAIFLFAQFPFNLELLWLDYLLWAIYIGGFLFFAFWTKKKPFYAILGALILFGVFIIINAILDPTTIVSGLLVKIIVVVFLVKGLSDARQAQAMKQRL